METKQKRGSEELARRLEEPMSISRDQLRQLVKTAEGASARILNWEIFGQPGIDRLRATFSIAPERLPAFVERLVKDKSRFTMKVFPKGIPPLEMEEYEVEIGQGFGG